MIKAIIFDCFGVLAENGWGLIDDRLSPSDEQWSQMSAMSHACDKGIISMTELMQGFADVLDVDKLEVQTIISSQRKNYPLLRYIKTELKPTYKIGLLSNVGGGFVRSYFNNEEQALFDALAISSEMTYVKPEPQAYKTAAEMLGVDLDECFFIDDSQLNVTAAKELGMKAVVYTDLDDLRQILAAI